MKFRQVPFFLYWRYENVQFWTNSIGHLGWLSRISNFPRFHKNVNSLELWKYVSENSSPKGSFWRSKRKSEFSFLSWDSRYLWAVALKSFIRFSTQFRVKESFKLLFTHKLRKFGDKSRNSLPTKKLWILVVRAGEYGALNWPITGRALT